MIIKKFLAKTEAEAVEAAKKELGESVVIMNVKTVKRKGLFRKKQVEVTAALEDDSASLRNVRRDAPKSTEQLESQIKATQDAVNVMSESSMNIEKKLESLQLLLEAQMKEREAKEAETTKEAADEKEEAEESAESKELTEQERFIRLLYNTMLENEVDEKYANQIVDDIDGEGKQNLPFDYILANIYQKMILKFGKSEGITPATKLPKIVIFMGPTGVGKTTTIAKIASKYVVEENKKVAMMTTDTYRIAAAEQLRIYANILEVPFRVIYSEEEVKAAIYDFRDCDYIFVDTAGHSHQNEGQLEHTKQLIAAMEQAGECQTFLVLSATTKYRDLLRIAAKYSEITEHQLIFTKLDETSMLGNLLNIKLATDTPIAFVTCGQNVPNDIEQFNPQKTVKEILTSKYERMS